MGILAPPGACGSKKGDAISSTGLNLALAAIAAAAAAVAVWRSILAGRQAREAKKSREPIAVISLFKDLFYTETTNVRYVC